MFQKYIDIDSTYRDREQFPDPNNFIVNFDNLVYSGSQYGQTQYVNYQIKLENLIIPNLDIYENGVLSDNIKTFPYLYVEFGNVNNISSTIYSNNSNSRHCIFKVPVTDDSYNTQSSFLTLKCNMIQTIKYKPNSDHKLTIRLPNGEVLKYLADDLLPNPPNRLLQTSATFCIKQIIL